MCSCGVVNRELKLSDREWTCWSLWDANNVFITEIKGWRGSKEGELTDDAIGRHIADCINPKWFPINVGLPVCPDSGEIPVMVTLKYQREFSDDIQTWVCEMLYRCKGNPPHNWVFRQGGWFGNNIEVIAWRYLPEPYTNIHEQD